MKPSIFFSWARLLPLVLLGLLSFLANAQNNAPVRTPAPVTPNAAALFRAQAHPVGPYTGTTPISIPLFSVGSGSLRTSVDLGYSNGGVKVEEIASWAGLGWNLSAGGRVTRVMKGIPDDGGGMLSPTAVKPSQLRSGLLEDLNNAYWGTLDAEPDMYYFDVNGLSGKFFFNEAGEPQLVGMAAIRIERVMDGSLIKGWVITDGQGTKYYFGRDRQNTASATDETTATYQSNVFATTIFNYISSWHLLEIRDLSGHDQIRFSYVKNQVSFTTPSSSTRAIGGFLGSIECRPEDQVSEASAVTNETFESYLSSITFADGRLDFESTADRQDYMGGRRLNAIKQYNGSGQLLRSFAFDHGYFTMAGAPTDTFSDSIYKRLKLKKLTEQGKAGSVALVHGFEYEETVNLPSRLSKAVDYWGYYNGRETNTTFLPSGSYYVDGQLFTRLDLADRRSDAGYAVANTLKKITYPTGGSRRFLYEGNMALLEQHSQLMADEANYSLKDFHQTTGSYVDDETPSASYEFTIATQEASTEFSFGLRATLPASFEVRISHGGPMGSLVQSFSNVKSGSLMLGSGTYRIELFHGYAPDFSFDYLSGSWREKNSPVLQVQRYGQNFVSMGNVGGIRVRELIDTDPVTGSSVSTSYQYALPGNAALTSGLLITPPLFAYKVPVPGCISLCTLSSTSAYPLSSEGGSYVVYPEVRTIQQNNGHTDRLYSFSFEQTAFDSTSPVGKFPMIPTVDAGWRRNKLLSEQHYDNSGNLLSKSLSTGILVPGEYDLTTNEHIMHTIQFGFKVYGRHLVSQQPSENPGYIKTEGYKLHSQFTATLGTKDISYSADGQTELRKEYDYYTEIGWPVLKGERTYLSNGKVRSTVYRYAFNSAADFVFGLDAQEQAMKATLLAQYYLQPLETVVTVGPVGGTGVVVGGEKTIFGTFNGALQVAASRQYSSATDFTETVFDAYHATTGRLLQYHQKDGRPRAFLYSYNGQYPVAEVDNAGYAQVEAALGAGNVAAFHNQAAPDRAAVDSFLAPLRTALPNAFITGFSYGPLVGMASQTDSKGMVTTYEYDTFNRLENIKDRNGDIVKNYRYNYADGSGLPPVTVTFRSAEVKLSRTRNNCTTGTGSSVVYTVPEGRYTSTVDQATANALAQADADANAQANANQYGTCGTPEPGTVSLNYSFPGSVQFKLRITHTATSAYIDHTLSGSGTLTGITAGTVNLALSEVTATSTVYSFSLNGTSKSGNSTSFDSFSFTATANLSVTVPPVGGPYYNTAQTIVKTKNNCPSGTGTSVSYAVVAGSYSSQVSVADANQLALAGEDARAQANANALGGCTIDNTTIYYSQLTLVTKARNNCPNGVSGVPQTMSYPLGAYTSSISVADADQQLHNAAQVSVNNSGGCAVTSGTFTLDFKAPLISHFSVHFKDAAGNTLRELTIHGNHVISSLPGGTGSITVAPWPSPPAGLTFSYSVNGGTAQATAPAVFTGIALSGTVNVTVVQTRFANKVLSVTKARNNCPSGENGTSVSYVVPESTYWSTISQADADGKAQADANTNAQNYANQNGTCEIATTPISVYHPVGTKVLIEITHLSRNTTVSYNSIGNGAGNPIYVPIGQSKVKITSLESGKTYRVVLSGVVQTGSTIEYPSVNLPNYTVYLSMQEVFSNSLLTVSKTKNNCYNAHQIGEAITYTVPAGKYTSVVSQTDADQLAQDDADANAQDYANANGTCIPVYYNSARYLSKTKNDCPSGQIGTAVDYYIGYGRYTSTISQADADQKALTGEDASAQANANANGNCTLPPTYYSAYLSVTKTRNNCAVGYTGTSVNYVVNYGKYTSLISQADANAKAQAEVEANAQNYANANGTCTPPVTYYNQAVYRYLQKNNCAVGDIGSSVSYTVPYQKYSSLISQADADAKAQADLNANAQNYANANGTCTTPVFTLDYSVPDDVAFTIKMHNPSLGLTIYHTIYGTGSLLNIRGGLGWNVDIYPEVADEVNYRFSLYSGGATGFGNTVSFTGLYFSGNVALSITR